MYQSHWRLAFSVTRVCHTCTYNYVPRSLSKAPTHCLRKVKMLICAFFRMALGRYKGCPVGRHPADICHVGWIGSPSHPRMCAIWRDDTSVENSGGSWQNPPLGVIRQIVSSHDIITGIMLHKCLLSFLISLLELVWIMSLLLVTP